MNTRIALALAAVAVTGSVAAYIVSDKTLSLFPVEGPLQISGLEDTNKVKLLRTPDGTLFAIYGEGQEAGGLLAYDVKGQETRKPFDIVVSVSTDNGDSWSAPLNISNTAGLTSSKGILGGFGQPALGVDGHPDLALDANAVDYPGDNDKPNVFNVGNNILVTWAGKYCPGGNQRFVVYPELNGVTVPYSCMYVSRLQWNPNTQAFNTPWPGALPYLTERLSDGLRDVKQDANRGSQVAFVINWQEDPLGLKLGEAEGPGDGASGANVNNGTDIWYSYLAAPLFTTASWSTATRITANTRETDALSSSGDVLTHPAGNYDKGQLGASRSNIAQIGPNVIIAYEETKSTQGFDEGKYVRYHHFTWNAPPLGGEAGCIISRPQENARRVRMLTQDLSNPTPLVFIYKQGDYTQGGPSDIFVRRSTGNAITLESLDPPIDAANCRSSINDGGDPLVDVVHPAEFNFSGTDEIDGITGTAPDVLSGANPIENALAHRGTMRGNTILIGYSYTPDLARFQLLDDTAPYNFYIRRSTDGGATWSEAVNMTPEVTGPSQLTVKEPRIVPTPPTVASGLPEDVQDPGVIYVGYGLQTNVRQPLFTPQDVDIYMMVSLDEGATWSAAKAITAGNVLGGFADTLDDFETQVKVRPDGREAYVVWSSSDGTTAADFRRLEVADNTIFVDGFEE